MEPITDPALTYERDPLFARYEAAWRAYQDQQAAASSTALPCERAITESVHPSVRAAAIELAAARHAWHADLEA